ncbi:hypothetical protein NQ314_004240 [Rhamnusium bicolor]|uniref:DDE-1 domain-containing protein n=1 Tax=Rhamnusium bicolor TaxID=1586634 RepID=A0AAV8ZJZ3_9CUCU|nr:hypothetical protein NQ314_004240 [Rhamnusium bicolor]
MSITLPRVVVPKGENNTTGIALPPIFIFPRIRNVEDYVEDGSALSVAFGNKSRWMTGDLFVKILRHIVNHTKWFSAHSKVDVQFLLLIGCPVILDKQSLSFEKSGLRPLNSSAFSEDYFDATFVYNEPPTSRTAQEISTPNEEANVESETTNSTKQVTEAEANITNKPSTSRAELSAIINKDERIENEKCESSETITKKKKTTATNQIAL